ncbi:tetratricopeptide repeat protein [bacterium]|nr:tetratricopeptide repeat protein [bacterium]MBU1984745.1 tetratricopeptide repeat protein [bacterium]
MLKRISLLLMLACGLWLATTAAQAAKNEALDKAREAASHDEWEDAMHWAQQAVELEPKNEDAWALLGNTQMALGDTTSAVGSWEKAVSYDPRHTGAVLALTDHYLESNRVVDAERVVAAGEEKDKKGRIDEIKVARGLIFAHAGNMPEATKILASATAKNPKNPLYPQILARIYESKQVYDLAEKHYADAWALAPGDPVLAFEYGVVLQQQKKYKEALDLFKVVQEKDPNNKTVDYLVGRLYFAAGRYVEAARQFEMAVEKRPDHFLSNLLLGRSYYELSKSEKVDFYEKAVEWLRKASELKPDREDVKVLLAEVLLTRSRVSYAQAGQADQADVESDLMRLLYQRNLEELHGLVGNDKELQAAIDKVLVKLTSERQEEAKRRAKLLMLGIEYAREALTLNPTLPGAHGHIARCFDKLGLLDSAVVYQRVQYEMTPDDKTEFKRLVNMTQRLNRQGDLITLLQPMMGDTAMLARYGLILANAQIETANYNDARATIKQIVEYDPTYCDAHQLNAYIDLKRERYAEAIPALRAGVRSCPKESSLWVYLGDCLYFSNPKDKDTVKEAKEAYTKACALHNPDGCEKKEQVTELLKTLR